MKPVNLLPGEHKHARRAGESNGSAYAVLGVLGVLLVMATVYVLTANKVNERTTAADAASQEASRLEAQALELGSFSDFASVAQTRAVAVQSVAASRFDWERLMQELAHVMPKGSWLSTTDASVGGASVLANGPPSDISESGSGGPSAALVGCTPSQTDVARMMVRLRRMYRVIDVELNESTEGEDTGPATIDSCGSLYAFDITVVFAPTAPEREAPTGADSVPAALGGGS